MNCSVAADRANYKSDTAHATLFGAKDKGDFDRR